MKISVEELLDYLSDAVWYAVWQDETAYENIKTEMRLTLEMLAAEGRL